MMFKAAIAAVAVLAVLVTFLYWDRGRIAHKLEITETRLIAAQTDAATKAETLEALEAHAARLLVLDLERDVSETTIRNSEGFGDEVPDIILDTISNLGMRPGSD